MARVIWAAPALNELNEIAEYIALDNAQAAKKLVKQIFKSTALLQEFPESGRSPPELPTSRYRERMIGPCRVLYRHNKDADEVYILPIVRTERELRRYILDNR